VRLEKWVTIIQSIASKQILLVHPGADPASTFRGGDFSNIGGQVSKQRDEACFTKLLRQNNRRQNYLIPRILFFELYKIMVYRVTFVGFRGGDYPSPHDAPGCTIRPWMHR